MFILFAQGRASVLSSFLFVVVSTFIALFSVQRSAFSVQPFADLDAPRLSVNGNYTVTYNDTSSQSFRFT